MHGDEFSQQLVLKRFLDNAPNLKRGSVTILPRLNPGGLAANSEINPTDGLNINRVFPGRAVTPSISRKIARMTFDMAKQSDGVIDLHNFTDPAIPQTIFVDTGPSPLRELLLTMCRMNNFPLIWRIRANDPGMADAKRTLIYNVVRAGIPAIGVELPPLDVVTEREIKMGEQGVRAVIQFMINGTIGNMTDRQAVIDRINLRSPQDGIFIPMRSLGSLVRSSSVIGKIIMKNYNTLTISAGTTGILTRIRRAGPITKEQLICNIGIKTKR